MVDLVGHEAGNGGYQPRKAYRSPALLYSEEVKEVRVLPEETFRS